MSMLIWINLVSIQTIMHFINKITSLGVSEIQCRKKWTGLNPGIREYDFYWRCSFQWYSYFLSWKFSATKTQDLRQLSQKLSQHMKSCLSDDNTSARLAFMGVKLYFLKQVNFIALYFSLQKKKQIFLSWFQICPPNTGEDYISFLISQYAAIFHEEL